MSIIRAPLDASQTADCDRIAGVLHRDGIAVLRYDAITTDTVDGRERVTGVYLHVVAEQDIPSGLPDPSDPIQYGAGDCWQEVWYAWDDPRAPNPGLQAMRVI